MGPLLQLCQIIADRNQLNSMIKALPLLLLLDIAITQYCDSTGCLPCYYRCQSCLGLTQYQCTSCLENYLLVNGSCVVCSNNCLSCGTSPNGSLVCQTCNQQFYVQQSTGSCNPCPTGALSCTFAAVQQCLSGFYLQNSICFYCITNCQICSNAYTCTTCDIGYVLTSSGSCSACALSTCSTCNSNGSCQICNSGFYGLACKDYCPNFCSICDGTSCYQCDPTYYLTTNGTCQAASILCSNPDGPNSCVGCLPDIAYYTNNLCSPYYSVHLTNIQLYYRAPNDLSSFLGASLVECPLFNFATIGKGSLSLQIGIQFIYKLEVSLQIVTLLSESPEMVTISSSNLIQTFNKTVSSLYGYSCNNQTVVLSNFNVAFTPNRTDAKLITNLTLQFRVASGSFIGVTQVLVEEYLCQISGCGICQTGYTCAKCQPPLLLEDNSCLQVCSSGYYLTTLLSTCTLVCPTKFYAILEDYSCEPCIPPCLACSSVNSCVSCQSGWFLLEISCLVECPSGYYQNEMSGRCSSCRYPCLTCSISSMNCTACNLGYLEQNGLCTMSCRDGYYQNFSSISCQPCSSTCSTCRFNQFQCNSCVGLLLLNPNATCLSSCDSTYAHNYAANLCEKCKYPCKNCLNTSTQCLSCQSGYAFNMACISVCPQGYFNSITSKTCDPCQNNCSTCLTSVQCLSCLPSFYFYSQQQSCIQTCPNITYPLNNSCVQCNPPCSSCSNYTYCLTCVGSLFVYFQGKCLLSCPSFTYFTVNNSSKLKICQPCGLNCSSCLNKVSCLQCSNSYLFNGNCLQNCPSLTYPYQGNCISCSFPCLACLASDLCLSCVFSYYYYSATMSCQQTCPGGFYPSDGVCVTCNPECGLCRNGSSCVTCAPNYYQNPNLSCSSSCPIGYYAYAPQASCKQCSSVCLQCLQGTLCISCNSSSPYPYFHKYSCISDCPTGYITQGSNCRACTSTCATCMYSIDNCTSCNQDKYLLLNASRNQCLQFCPNGYYPNAATLCLTCVTPCLSCISQIHCLSCISPAYPLYNGRCLINCPSNYFIEFTGNYSTCIRCDSNCLTCVTTSSNCSSCGPNSFLIVNSTISVCSVVCPYGSHADSLSQTCLQCQIPCKNCITSSYCSSCIDGYYLYIDICLLNCPEGYYQIQTQSICQLCTLPCASCQSTELCLSCTKGYFFNEKNYTCLQSCESGTYVFQTSDGNMQCLACPISCLQCYDYSACKSCIPNSTLPYLQGTACKSGCTDGYFLQTSFLKCQACGWGCFDCSSSACIRCSDSYLYLGACQAQCPLAYYESTDFTCQICLSPCYQCYDASNCQNCLTGYFLYLTHCIMTCPTEMWAITGLDICNQTCSPPLYRIPSKRLCVTSCQFYFDEQGNCVQQCGYKEMANESLGCESCLVMDCNKKLYFQLNSLQKDGQFYLYMIFNQDIDNRQLFYTSALNISFGPSASAGWNELQISGLRSLHTISSNIYDSDLELISYSSKLLVLSINFENYTSTFSGTITVAVNNLRVFTNQGYPLQAVSNTLQVDWFQVSGSGKSATYIAYLISGIFFLTLLVNFVLDNTRAVLVMVDGLQGLHMMIYLQVWYHPLVQNYLLALRFTAFRMPLFQITSASVWNCSSKYLEVYEGCAVLNELILPAISIIVLITIAVVCRFVKYFNNRHKFCWNHLFNIFWICLLGPAVSSFHYLMHSTQDIEIAVAALISGTFLLFSLLLVFQIIKNVLSGSYAEKCLFWGLRKQHSEHPLANLHPLFVLMRRVVLGIGIGMADDSPLSCLFILTLLTIFIISNIIVNRAFRIGEVPIAAAEIVLALLLILLQMYIVNASKLANSNWNIFGIALFVLLVVYSVLLVSVCIKETYRVIIKHYRIISGKKNETEQPEGSEKSSNDSANLGKSQTNKIQKDIDENKQSEETQHQFLRRSSQEQSRQPKKSKIREQRVSQGLSQFTENDEGRIKADRILIKITKQEALQQQSRQSGE